MRILVADKLDNGGYAILADRQVELVDRGGIGADELLAEIAGFQGLVVRSRTQVTPELMDAATSLRVIGRAGTGVDNIDVGAATDRGITVMNTPGANSNSAAEHAIAMMFALLRNVPQADRSLRSGKFDKQAFCGNEVAGKALGIVGLGRIGCLVAEKAQGLGMKVLGFDPVTTAASAAKKGIELLDLMDLFGAADIISLHVPYNEKTHHLISRQALEVMKPSARIVNCARGGLIDEVALAEFLDGDKLAGAALDVFEIEPPVDNPLLDSPRVVVTPHLGASTVEAQEIVSRNILEQMADFLEHNKLRGAVNGLKFDPSTQGEVEPYCQLAGRLGKILSGLGGRGDQLTARYYGRVPTLNARALTSFFLQGYLGQFLTEDVNALNAAEKAKERGIQVEEVLRDTHKSFRSLLYFTMKGEEGTKAIAGCIFGRENLRIVRLSHMNLDAVPEGLMLVVSNLDRPGILGKITSALGDSGVNIGNMSLGRDAEDNRAIAIFNLDDRPAGSVLATIRQFDGVLDVSLVDAG